jgi:hypothetical protein
MIFTTEKPDFTPATPPNLLGAINYCKQPPNLQLVGGRTAFQRINLIFLTKRKYRFRALMR